LTELKTLPGFWDKQKAKSKEMEGRIRFVNFTDGEPELIEIKKWTVKIWEYQSKTWDDAEIIEIQDGRWLKINNKSLVDQLMPHSKKHMHFEITRYNSQPNPLKTHFVVRVLGQARFDNELQKQTLKDSD